MTIEEVKLFLRIDGDYENTLLVALQDSAEEYMTNAGVAKDYLKSTYTLAIKILIGHWYENRGAIGKTDRLAFSLDAIILQLKYTQAEVIV